jgi:hypothetical protein
MVHTTPLQKYDSKQKEEYERTFSALMATNINTGSEMIKR